jgi:hypothetical protein
MTNEKSILAYEPPPNTSPGWWEFWTGGLFVRVPEDVKRRLAIAKAAHGIANQLAPLEPEANRQILYQAAEILGVLKDKEVNER